MGILILPAESISSNMRHTVVFIACLLCALVATSYSATVVKSGLLSYNGMVVTSNGDGKQVTLAPIDACDKTQEWVLDSDGYIYQKSNATLVLDVQNSNTLNGAIVIMWIKKPPTSDTANQRWNVSSVGVQTKLPGSSFLKKSVSSNGVVTTTDLSNPQLFQFIDPPYTCPVTCTSQGDPHFTSWAQRRFDFQSANTVLLANFSGNRVYAVQFACAPGVTCNEGFVVHVAGTSDTFQLSGATTAYYNKMMVNVPMGTTSFGSFINVTKVSNTAFNVNIPRATISYGAYRWVYGAYVNLAVTLTGSAVLAPSLCVGPAAGQNPHTFGSQFLVKNANDTAYQYGWTPFSYNPNYVPNYGPYVPADPAFGQKAMDACNALTTTYPSCVALVPPDFYITSCYNDVIATGDMQFVQINFDAYAYLCSEAAKRNGTTITFPTSATTTVIVGAETTLNPNTLTWFTIIAKDINGNPRTSGGDMFNITSGPRKLDFTIVDNMNGTYTVWYNTGEEGWFTIWVKLNSSDVSNSPFNVTVVAATSATTTTLIIGPSPVNTQHCFTIQARTSAGNNRMGGGDTFVVNFSGDTFANVMVYDKMDGTYNVCYTPLMAGYFTVDVKFNGASIMCAPYTVLVK